MIIVLVLIDVFGAWEYDRHPETAHTSLLNQKNQSEISKVPDQSNKVPDWSREAQIASS